MIKKCPACKSNFGLVSVPMKDGKGKIVVDKSNMTTPVYLEIQKCTHCNREIHYGRLLSAEDNRR